VCNGEVSDLCPAPYCGDNLEEDRVGGECSARECGVGTRKLRLRRIHKGSICINSGKPVRRFVATT
jgi:hypothetical protein